MHDVADGPGRGGAWSSGAKSASAVGGITALVFGIWWFREVSGHCGVVRYYEYLLGIFVIGGWLIGTATGWGIVVGSRRRNPTARPIVGWLVVMLVNGLLVAGSTALYYQHLAANLSFHDDEELLDMLVGDSLDAKVLAAHKLGERRSVEALPLLADLLEDNAQDINLRHNAAIALGNICAAPRRPEASCERALVALIDTLKVHDEFLPSSITDALGEIGDARAIVPLFEFVQDPSRSLYSREDAARALGRIGGEKSRMALERIHENSDNEDIRKTAEHILNTTKK